MVFYSNHFPDLVNCFFLTKEKRMKISSAEASRGLWTWPPWVICAPAFNQKIGTAAQSGVSEALFFTKSYKWKKQRWKKWTTGRLFRETMRFWRSTTVRQFHDGWLTNPITTEIITSRCGLTLTCLFSVISLQQFLRWKFRNMFTE